MAFNAEQTGNKIRSLREARNWSQQHLGKQLNMSCSYIGRIERGERTAHVGVYISVAQLFDVPLEYLLTDKSPKISRKKVKLAIGILEEIELER